MNIKKGTALVFKHESESICGDKEDQYTVSDLIALLEKAKELWGDQKVLVYDSTWGSACGFSDVCAMLDPDESACSGKPILDAICIII